jgi:hypothetical protein
MSQMHLMRGKQDDGSTVVLYKEWEMGWKFDMRVIAIYTCNITCRCCELLLIN